MTNTYDAHTVAQHPQALKLATLVYDCLMEAVASAQLNIAASVMRKAQAANLSRQDAEFARTNLFDALSLPVQSPDASSLVANLLAFAISQKKAKKLDETVPKALVWLATYANVDTFTSLDALSPPHAEVVWNAVADMIWAHGTNGSQLPRAEAIVAALCLGVSRNPLAVERKAQVARLIAVPILINALQAQSPHADASGTWQPAMSLATGTLIQDFSATPEPVLLESSTGVAAQPIPQALLVTDSQAEVSGPLAPCPRSTAATILTALCGWLFISHVAGLFAKVAFKLQRPTRVSLSPQGVRIATKTILLGRTIKDENQLICWSGLAKTYREVQFARIGLYTGLLALGIGSLIGLSWLINGLKSGSWWLIVVGIAIIVTGVAMDFMLTSLLPSKKSTCRLVFVTRNRKKTCLSPVDVVQADALLRQIANIAGS